MTSPIAFSIKHLIQVDGPTAYSCKSEPTMASNDRSEHICPGSDECPNTSHRVCVVRPLPALRMLVEDLGLSMNTNIVLDGVEWVSTSDVFRRGEVLLPEEAKKYIYEAFIDAVDEDIVSWDVSELIVSAFSDCWDHRIRTRNDPLSDKASRLSIRALFAFYYNSAEGYIDFGPHNTLKSAVNHCVAHRGTRKHVLLETASPPTTAQWIVDLQSLVIRLTQKVDGLTEAGKKKEMQEGKKKEKRMESAKRIVAMDSASSGSSSGSDCD